jgi:hypothetical protein
MEPVDEALVARVHAMEEALKEKERAVQELREKVPRLAADKTREQLYHTLKRSSDVMLVCVHISLPFWPTGWGLKWICTADDSVPDAGENDPPLHLEDKHIEVIKETYETVRHEDVVLVCWNMV